MIYLRAGLYAEGPSDYEFLGLDQAHADRISSGSK
jgi:hypothetical protein